MLQVLVIEAAAVDGVELRLLLLLQSVVDYGVER